MDPTDTQRQAFGRYQVVRTLGEGAAGSVYLAHDDLLGRDVAVKTLRGVYRGSFSGELLGARFNNEARAVATLTNPNIVRMFDMGIEDGTPYLVMEVVSGPSLKERLAEGRLAAATVRALGIQMAQALGEAHGHGIVHRDVKPANILEAKPDHFKLADFGVAHVPDSSLTLTGQFLGTPAYAAPETVARGEFGPASDVYGLCATLYEALAGQPPYDADPARRLEAMASGAPPAPLGEIAPDAPPDLVAAITRGLDADPAARPDAPGLAELLASASAAAPAETPSELSAEAGAAAAPALAAAPSPVAERAAAAAATAALANTELAAPAPDSVLHAGGAEAGAGPVAAPGSARQPARRSRPVMIGGGLLVLAAIAGGAYLVSRVGSSGEAPRVALASGKPSAVGPSKAQPAHAGPTHVGTDAGTHVGTAGPTHVGTAGGAHVGTAGGTHVGTPADAGAAAEARVPAPDRVPGVAHAERLIRAHHRSSALRALSALRKRYPKNAYVPFLIGNLYFDKMWWRQGFAAYHDAIALDPGYRRHPTVIHNAIRSLMSNHSAWLGIRFLENEVGRAAVPALRDAAAHSRSLHIQRRAARILRHFGR